MNPAIVGAAYVTWAGGVRGERTKRLKRPVPGQAKPRHTGRTRWEANA